MISSMFNPRLPRQDYLSANIAHQAAMDNHIRETISPELAKQIRDLSGIANNVNQIAHQMHIDGFDAVKDQCLHIIAASSSIINQVKPMRHDS